MLGLSSLHARAREEGHYTWSAHVHLWVGVLKEPVLITYTYLDGGVLMVRMTSDHVE